MKNPLQTFEPNEIGRDFVIGDLHGSLSCFENLLVNIAFDKTKDRMFSVGDLVDRGPDSLKCLELIKEPWFHCVLANHEQMMQEAFNGGYMGNFWVQNGGYWGHTALEDWKKKKPLNESDQHVPDPDSTKLFDLLPLVDELPFVITVKMKGGNKFHIIHAELPPGHSITDDVLSSPDKILELAKIQSRDGDFFLWGRFMFAPLYGMDFSRCEKLKRVIAYRYRESYGVFNDKLSHIISGHTIMHHPITVIGQTNIDTCAYSSYDREAKKHNALTCVELGTWAFYQATSETFRPVLPITVNIDDIEKLRQNKELSHEVTY